MLSLRIFSLGFGLRFGCVLLAAGPASFAQNQSLTSQIEASPSSVHSAPLEIILDKPFVSVMVNGRGPYRFLIDTGTGTQAIISPALADELALPVVGHARLTDPSRQGEQRSDIRLIDSLEIGGIEFQEIEAVRHGLFAQDENCQGVLGFTLFEDYLLTLDFPDRQLILSTGALSQGSGAGGALLPFRMPDGVPIVSLSIDEIPVEALIDSGGTGLSLPEPVAAQMKFLSPPIEFGRAESLSTTFLLKAARLRPDVRLGPYSFRQAFVEINPAFPLVNLGSTPLKNFIITFDQAEQVMRIYSSQKTLRLDASPTMMRLLNEPRRQATDRTLVPVG